MAKFYAVTQSKEHPQVPLAKSVDIPELPGKVKRLSDNALTRFAQEVAASAISAQQVQSLARPASPYRRKHLAQKQSDELRRSNAALSHECDRLRHEADQLRGLDLPEVLIKLYGARETQDSKPSYKTRKFELSDGSKVAATGELWIDNSSGKGGKGAINLVMHLSGYGQD